MRRTVGLVLLGLGVFLLVLAPLARFYAYPKLAVAPIDQDSVSTLVGPDANIFDTSTFSNITTDLTTTALTVGDIEASEEAPGNTRVWVNSSSTKDSEGNIRSRSIERVAFDATTGEAVNCCDEYIEETEGEREPVERSGLVYKFPFGTEKKDYEFWDTDLGEALPIMYDSVEDVEGVETYKFVQEIEPTVLSTEEVPASILDLDVEGNVEADMTYSNVRTLWVEPRTGVILKRSEEQYNTIEYEGEERLVTTDVTTGYDDATVKANADEYGTLGTLLTLVHTTGPIIALILGLLLAVLGFLLSTGRLGGNTPAPRRSARDSGGA